MLRPLFTFIAILFSALFLSCSNPEEKKDTSEGDKAYEELKEFVIATEEDAETELESKDIDSTRLQLEITTLKSQFENFENKVGQNLEQFTPHQREVLMDLRDRFNIAINKKLRKFNDANRHHKLRQKLLGDDVKSEDLKEITPANIITSYSHFVKTVEQEKDSYTEQDWQTVNTVWLDLNSRKTELLDELKPADTVAIANQREQFTAINKIRS